MEEKDLIRVSSLKLFKRIYDAKQIHMIKRAYPEESNGFRPVFYFEDTKEIRKIVDEFVKEYGEDNFLLDGDQAALQGNNIKENYDNLITCANYKLLSMIVDSGYLQYIASVRITCKKQVFKVIFYFWPNDSIKEIKADFQDKNYKYYHNHKSEFKKEKEEKKMEKQESIFVRYFDIANKIIENGYFNDLTGMRVNLKNPSTYVYWFKNKPEIQKIIDDANAEWKAAHTAQKDIPHD